MTNRIRILTLAALPLMAACEDATAPPLAPETTAAAALTGAGVCDGKPTHVGTDGYNFMWGTPQGDKMLGRGGTDRIYSYGGDDCLIGGEGNDWLHAGFGNDVLIGGDGDDVLDAGMMGAKRIMGGPGDDIIHAAFGDDGETSEIQAGEGDDRIFADDGAPDVIDCGEGIDEVRADATDTLHGCEIIIF